MKDKNSNNKLINNNYVSYSFHNILSHLNQEEIITCQQLNKKIYDTIIPRHSNQIIRKIYKISYNRHDPLIKKFEKRCKNLENDQKTAYKNQIITYNKYHINILNGIDKEFINYFQKKFKQIIPDTKEITIDVNQMAKYFHSGKNLPKIINKSFSKIPSWITTLNIHFPPYESQVNYYNFFSLLPPNITILNINFPKILTMQELIIICENIPKNIKIFNYSSIIKMYNFLDSTSKIYFNHPNREIILTSLQRLPSTIEKIKISEFANPLAKNTDIVIILAVVFLDQYISKFLKPIIIFNNNLKLHQQITVSKNTQILAAKALIKVIDGSEQIETLEQFKKELMQEELADIYEKVQKIWFCKKKNGIIKNN